MRIRTHFYCLFFSALPVSAVAMSDSQNTVIPPVIVKAKQTLSLTAGPKTVITHEQMTATGVTTLAQALQSLGGVQLQDTAGNGSQVLLSMRGFGANASSNTLMLVNGIPLTNPDLAPPDLNAIPISEIKYIEIIAGSESVLYGDQAVGGIINVITHPEKKERVALSCGAGSYNQKNCYATYSHHYRQLNFDITASASHTDNYRDHNDYDQALVFGKLDYPYQTGRISFDYKLAKENMQYPGALTAAQVRQDRRQASNNTDFFKDWSDFFHLRHQQNLNERWHLLTDLAFREMQGDGVLSVPFTQSRNILYVKPQLAGKLGTTRVTGGADFQSDRYHLDSAFGTTKDDEQKYGLFGIARMPIYPKLTLSLGARGAQQNSRLTTTTENNNINRAFASTVGILYQITTDIDFYLRRAGSFRFPKADENAATASGITSLRTQRGIAYETGVQMEREEYSAKIELYQLDLRDEIAFDPTQTPQDPFGSNRNLSPTQRRGFTLSGKRKITQQLTVDGQYNYVNARFQDGINAGNRIPLVAENVLRAGLNYQFAQYWQAYTEALYTGNQYAANDDANVAGKTGGFTTFNFNLRYTYRKLAASFRVNNIFDRDYYFYTVYQPSMQSEFFYPAPGRNFTLIVNYLFD
ncbi:TonB-dependent receptor family protein [Aquicella lusitana]|uniref:Iron complex outermembrane receptor protein n=1 Tax=Aquicella lusitana TaxID=254246 RepID=A0A370GSR1_9COXI|nr:TonB-dependent receptor [Aquicella lusitana]RDI46479.1 iron complex outermembrane receptor protein [Aquicella lusitana]VVC74143.1 Vitamin B12 transporter BtuB [Aquicella lusitana]